MSIAELLEMVEMRVPGVSRSEDHDLLANQVAIVSGGAGSGIGHGISLQLAKAGAHVVIADCDRAAGAAVVAQITALGHCASSLHVDVTKPTSVQGLVTAVLNQFNRIDILVNSAGVGLVKPAHLVTDEEFNRLIDVDLRGVWLCSKYVLPFMRQQQRGSIVNIASIHRQASMPGYELYAAAKAGVTALTRGTAIQYGGDGIRANAISPGLVDGPQTRDIIARSTSDVGAWMDSYRRCSQAMPLSIQAMDIGNLVVFLASNLSRCITGVDIPVDCGALCLLAAKNA